MSYTFIEGYHGHMSGSQSHVNHIVLHGTVSALHRGGAREVAQYFQSPNSGGLAHFTVDEAEVIQCCREDVVCWHAPPNPNSLGVEMCDPQSGPDFRWKDADHEELLNTTARLVAELAQRWHVPIAYLSVSDLQAGHRGITTHNNQSLAFRQSDHSDPGPGFPIAHFMEMVSGHHAAFHRPAGVPAWWPHDLGVGSVGGPVKVVQQKLAIPVDGHFGIDTQHAVMRRQHGWNIKQSGVVDAAMAIKMGP